MGSDSQKTTTKIIKIVLGILSWIWLTFWTLFMLLIIFASNNTGGKFVGFIVFSIIASSPAIIYILKRHKSKKNIVAKKNLIIEQEILKVENENKPYNTETLLETNNDTSQSLTSLKYLKKKKKAIIVIAAIIGLITVFSYKSFLGIVRSIQITNVTVNKDTKDRNGRVELDVNIKGLGNYFIEEAYVYKKDDMDKEKYTYVDAYNITAVTGKTIWFNSRNQNVHTSLNKKLYNASNNSTSALEGEYVLVVKSRLNRVSNTFTISKQIIDETLLVEQLQKEKSKEATIQKEIEDKKVTEVPDANVEKEYVVKVKDYLLKIGKENIIISQELNDFSSSDKLPKAMISLQSICKELRSLSAPSDRFSEIDSLIDQGCSQYIESAASIGEAVTKFNSSYIDESVDQSKTAGNYFKEALSKMNEYGYKIE